MQFEFGAAGVAPDPTDNDVRRAAVATRSGV